MRLGPGLGLGMLLAVGGAFKPAALPNLVLWTRADTVVGSPVSQWTDLSGNGNHIVQATLAKRPAVNASDAQYNNLPSLAWDGTNTAMGTVGNITLGAYTVWMVCRMTTTVGYLWKRPTALDYCYGSTANSINTTISAVVSGYNLSANWGQSASPRRVLVAYDGTHAGHVMYLNSVLQSLTTTFASDPGTTTRADPFCLFSPDGSTASSSGTIAEVVVLSGAISAGNRALLDAYGVARYGF
jgi:hypothetical protein